MNKKTQKLAKKAGFKFWGENEHGHNPNDINWGFDYSIEFEKMVALIIEDTKKKYCQPTSEDVRFSLH